MVTRDNRYVLAKEYNAGWTNGQIKNNIEYIIVSVRIILKFKLL